MLHSKPFLLFDGNCAEAMKFYHHCLGGELTLLKTGDSAMKELFPPEKHDKIINAHLKSGNIEFSATDWHADNVLPKKGNMFSLFVIGDTFDELKTIFDKLSEGADRDERTFMELHELPFAIYGQFTDKYGVGWIFRKNKNGTESKK